MNEWVSLGETPGFCVGWISVASFQERPPAKLLLVMVIAKMRLTTSQQTLRVLPVMISSALLHRSQHRALSGQSLEHF